MLSPHAERVEIRLRLQKVQALLDNPSLVSLPASDRAAFASTAELKRRRFGARRVAAEAGGGFGEFGKTRDAADGQEM